MLKRLRRALRAALTLTLFASCVTSEASSQIVDSPQLADSAFAEVLRQAERAPEFAGCYRVTQRVGLAPDSVEIPESFELLDEPYRDLGYHRLGVFRTNLPTVAGFWFPPIWAPLTGEAFRIELTPNVVADIYYRDLIVSLTDPGAFQAELRYVGREDSTVVGRASGVRVPCP